MGLGLRVLHVAGYGVKLGARGGSLVVEGGGERRVVPVSEVDLVVIATSGVSVTSRAMRLMLRSGVELVVLDHRGEPAGLLWPSYISRTPATRRAQYEAAANGLGVRIVGWIARRKIEGQACHLKSLSARLQSGEARSAAREIAGLALEAFESALKGGESGGLKAAAREAMKVEARAARIYWSTLASLLPGELGFTGRSRDSGDPVNSALNYGYGILYAAAWRAVALAGLDPYAGFLHSDRSGAPVLTFDMVELYRATAVDQPVVDMLLKGWRPRVENGRLDPRDREEIARIVVARLNRRAPGARWSLEEDMRREALNLARSLRSGGEWAPRSPCGRGEGV